MTNEQQDEILERVWTLEERGRSDASDLLADKELAATPADLEELAATGLVILRAGRVEFTEPGRARAREIIRRHRLAERLLHDVLSMSTEELEEEACSFEHNLTDGITDSICTLLGHPRQCPHRRPIPEGECCRQARESLEAVVTPLPKLQVGEWGTVAYLSAANLNRIQKLYAFGIVPGAPVQLVQRSPAFVLKVEETQVALEKAVAQDIFVRRHPFPASGGK
jgi:DtxR family Mn-dependent transcriptional regulator